MEKNERFALTLLLLARTEEEKELVNHILDALPPPLDKPEKPGGLLTGLPVLERFLPRKDAFFQKGENILRLARFYVTHDLFRWDKWHWLFSSLCERHRWEMALQIATVDRHKYERSAGYRRGSDEANKRYKEIRNFCLEKAAALWQKDPGCRIGDMVEALLDAIKKEGRSAHPRVIRRWLKTAEKAGHLTKPASASRPGRSAK